MLHILELQFSDVAQSQVIENDSLFSMTDVILTINDIRWINISYAATISIINIPYTSGTSSNI